MTRLIASILFALPFSLFAQDDAQLLSAEEQSVLFPQCLSDLASVAESERVSADTISQVLLKAKFDPRVITYDRRQPEFVETFSQYLLKRVTTWRIDKGREMMRKHKALLAELTQTYGIPGHYLVSFWGLETNYGTYKGKMPIIDSLATLACDQRRSEFFTKQLVLALQLLERESLDVENMVGSWAGAMGHTQFMPSAYLQYAIDGDGDGQVNLWESEEDALASAANFLNNLGWKPGYRWGREVELTSDFNYALAGKHQQKALADWSNAGVTKTDGSGLGSAKLDASLLVPAGHTGPSFLIYDNFDVILRWNNSEFYAIAVGHLADRIIGKSPLSKPLPDLPRYSIEEVKQLQAGLNSLGFDVGKADGIMGPATRKGIREFQASKNWIADGYPDANVFDAVLGSAS